MFKITENNMLYNLIICLRNKLFDWQILKSKKFDIPIIAVGNITVGGTGKTPHIEYFIKKFASEKRVAVLSRGYMRKTKGFVLAGENCTSQIIGDEPYQIFRKFPEILVAVDEKRVRGIEKLLALSNPPEMILLDDAFQHRQVMPSNNVLLINSQRPIFKDCVLPYGRLREPIAGIKRADSVIVTKCPNNFSEKEKNYFIKKIENYKKIPIYFSTFKYSVPKNIFTKKPMNTDVKQNFLIVTGVVNAAGLYEYLQNFAEKIEKIEFSDHHYFTQKDSRKIERKFAAFPPESLIVTTEKDSARLLNNPFFSNGLREKMFYVEIEVKFLC
jgi:tetraacyldisaccharide 4'-kinase